MKIEYAYAANEPWAAVKADLVGLICGGATFLTSLSTARAHLCSVEGDRGLGVWASSWNSDIYRESDLGQTLHYSFEEVTGAGVDGVFVSPMDGLGVWAGVPVGVIVAGQNSANAGNTTAAGVVRVAVNEYAVAFSFNYGAGRQLALVGEADGDWFGAGEYPRGFVVGLQAVAAGAAFADGVTKVPYFARVKNHAAAGDKFGLNAAALAIAAHPAATSGSVIGVNESVVWQSLPLELWSNPKAAHFGYARGVVLAPQKGVANDEYLTIGGKNYLVFRENATAAVAFALEV